MVRAQALQHADRLRAALAPPQLAEPRVRLGVRVNQQEPDGAAFVIEAAEQPGELSPDVRIGHPLGAQYPGDAEPGHGLADALERLELRPAQLQLRSGRDADGLNQVVHPALVRGQPASLVDREQCVVMPVVDPADRVAQLAGHPAGKLPPDALVQIHQGTFVPGQ
jgi:hypothetical protein